MLETINFKHRIVTVVIEEAIHFKNEFIDYEYLVMCDENIHILAANEKNYAHLIGINTLCTKEKFFDRCYQGTLQEEDFNFKKKGLNINQVKGQVREKINALPRLKKLFKGDVYIKNDFRKNKVHCALAFSDLEITFGYSKGKKSFPMTLLSRNYLSADARAPSLILRKKRNSNIYNELILGDKSAVEKLVDIIKNTDDLHLKNIIILLDDTV